MTERKLVTLEEIKEISSIEKADNLELASVRGWKVVVKKNAFKVGDKCVFFEVDSFLPLEKKYEFLRKGSLKKNGDGSEGLRLKTIKLRGQISQGLAMPLSDFDIYKESDTTWKYTNETGETYYLHPNLEEDLSRTFNVVKYEPAVAVHLSGKVKGNFPSDIPKTDQERAQNLFSSQKELEEILGHAFESTLKLDGTSATFYKKSDGVIGVCSRNLDLKLEDEGSVYVKIAKETGILELIPQGYAVQGEVYGNGVQGNHDNLTTVSIFIFDIWNMSDQKYLTPSERKDFFSQYLSGKHEKIKHVPDLGQKIFSPFTTLEELLELADKTSSINNKICEGIVFKRIDGKYSFKVISNKFLLGEE